MSYIDLHIHSVYSDGSNTLQEIKEQVIEKRLKTISISDHDTFEAYEHIARYEFPCTIIKGIEISAFDAVEQKNVHILGYGFQAETPHVEVLCNPILERRKAISLWQIKQLQQAGYQIEEAYILHLAKPSTSIYKQHIMQAMIDKGYSDRIYSQLYRTLFKHGGICVHPMEFVHVEKAIEAIHKDGGYAVLAHPYASKVVAQIPSYINYGLDGIETYHSSHKQVHIDHLHAIARNYDLIETGGSDAHGKYGDEPEIGIVIEGMKDEDITICEKNILFTQNN